MKPLKIVEAKIQPVTVEGLLRGVFSSKEIKFLFRDRSLANLARRAQALGLGMSKSDTFENDLLLLIFNNTAIANIGDAAGLRATTTAGSLWLSLHTADPGEAGTGVTSETAYTNYARQAVARASGAGGFTVTTSSVALASNADFPSCGATPGGAITHFGIVNTSSGAAKLLYSGTVTPNITMATGVIPRITTAAGIVTED
jgi:hypothetical protein